MKPKKKPKPDPPKSLPGSLGELPTRDLLRSIRQDLEDKAKQAGLARPDHPLKPPRSR